MLAVLLLGWAVLQGGRFILSPLLPAIIDDLSLTAATAGLALTAFQAVYAVTQYPSGRLSDEWSRATLILPGLGVLAVAFLAIGAAPNYLAFVAGAVLLGVGKGIYVTPSRALLSDLFVERRGRALGIYTAGTDLGGLVAAGVAALVLATTLPVVGLPADLHAALEAADWRSPFLPIAGLLALATLLYVWLNREPYRTGPASLELRATVRRLATTREQREVLAAYALFYFMVGGWINFLPTYLNAAKGVPEALASAGFALVFLTGIGTKPVAGWLSDRFPRRAVSVTGLLLATAALAGVVLASSVAALAACVVALALGYKTQFPIVDAILLEAAPDENMGGDLGAARALFLGVGSLGPAYVGIAASLAGYEVAFAGLAACLLVAAGIIGRQHRRRRAATPAPAGD
ncbi:MFS transporter [Haloglomus halophilum]|uniref:MFS transporter n=1 Tax=Haloglomus halophilum TaxID=2962672 RepID=UPI00331359A9